MKAHMFSSRGAILSLAILFVVGTAVAAIAQEVQRQTAPVTRADSGAAMYQTYCASCHGASGRGDGPAAAALKIAPTDLTQLARKYEGSFPAIDVEQVLTGQIGMAAHGSSEMPVWGYVFSKMGDEVLRVHNLVDYIALLQAK